MGEGKLLNLTGDPAEVFAACWQEPGAILLETQKPPLRERYSFIARAPGVRRQKHRCSSQDGHRTSASSVEPSTVIGRRAR